MPSVRAHLERRVREMIGRVSRIIQYARSKEIAKKVRKSEIPSFAAIYEESYLFDVFNQILI